MASHNKMDLIVKKYHPRGRRAPYKGKKISGEALKI